MNSAFRDIVHGFLKSKSVSHSVELCVWKGDKLVHGKDAKVVSNVMVSNLAIKKIGSDTVGFASRTLGIR
jgi:hypothetical protein